MDRNLLKFLADVAGLAAEQLDAAARPPTTTPPTAPPPVETPATAPPPPATPDEASAACSDVESQRCSLCAATGEALVAGPCGAACGRCLANAMPLVLEHLRHSANSLRVKNGLYEAALMDLDRRTRGLHEQMEAVMRGAEELKAERDHLVAERDAARAMRARAGVKRFVVVSDDMRTRAELCVDEATAGRFLLFCAREFPGAVIAVDDEPQDVDRLAQQAGLDFWREGSEKVFRLVDGIEGPLIAQAESDGQVDHVCDDAGGLRGGKELEHQAGLHAGPIFDLMPVMPQADQLSSAVLPSATPAPTGPSLAVRREAADREVEGLTALIAHVHDEQARLRPPPGEYTPPYHPPKSRHAAKTGRKRIGDWLETLHSRGLELASGLRTAQDVAEHLNPGSEVVEKARLSPQTLVKFKTQPEGRTVETLARIAVAMGRSDLLELRCREPDQTDPLEGARWTDLTTRTLN